MKTAKKVTETMVKNAFKRCPLFDTEQKARAFSAGYVDKVWILKGSGRYRGFYIVADSKNAAILNGHGFMGGEN